MNSQYRTYMKREIKKTYPLLIVGLLFLVFMAVITTSMTKGVYEGALLELSDHFTSHGVWGMGDVVNLFINAAFGGSISTYYTLAILVFLVVLLQQTFLHENRSGIADFLQVLPLRERDKVIMKLINAHVAIAIYTVSFGVILSLSCLSVNDNLQKVADYYYTSFTQINPYAVIWQSVLLRFLGMSSLYLVFFLTITCIHNRFLSYAVGIGLMISPAAFCLWYDDILRYGQERNLIVRYFVPCYFFPDTTYVDTSAGDSYTIVQWGDYGAHALFYVGTIVVAALLIVLAVRRKWHIREAHNVLMNEEVAVQFVITGISLCTALFGSAFVLEMISFQEGNYSMVSYWIMTALIGVVIYIILSVIRRLIEKRQQGM